MDAAGAGAGAWAYGSSGIFSPAAVAGQGSFASPLARSVPASPQTAFAHGSSGIGGAGSIPLARASVASPVPFPLAQPSPRPSFDTFISYRRSTGSHLARLLSVYLKAAGFRPFLGVEGFAEGAFDRAPVHTGVRGQRGGGVVRGGTGQVHH